MMAASVDRCHILLVRERGLIGRCPYRGRTLTLAEPAANELARLIAKLHADPAIDAECLRSVGTRVRRQRRGRKAQDAGNHDGGENCPAHCALSLRSARIY